MTLFVQFFYLGFFPTTAFLILASYTECGEIGWSVTYMTLVVAFLTFNEGGGFWVNHIDVAPRFSGILMGITNLAATVAASISPLVTGYLTNNHVSISIIISCLFLLFTR